MRAADVIALTTGRPSRSSTPSGSSRARTSPRSAFIPHAASCRESCRTHRCSSRRGPRSPRRRWAAASSPGSIREHGTELGEWWPAPPGREGRRDHRLQVDGPRRRGHRRRRPGPAPCPRARRGAPGLALVSAQLREQVGGGDRDVAARHLDARCATAYVRSRRMNSWWISSSERPCSSGRVATSRGSAPRIASHGTTRWTTSERSAKQRPRAVVHQRAATEREHGGRSVDQLPHDLGLERAERRLLARGEEVDDRAPAALDLGVGVEERSAQGGRDGRPERGLAGAHEADEGDVALGGAHARRDPRGASAAPRNLRRAHGLRALPDADLGRDRSSTP